MLCLSMKLNSRIGVIKMTELQEEIEESSKHLYRDLERAMKCIQKTINVRVQKLRDIAERQDVDKFAKPSDLER